MKFLWILSFVISPLLAYAGFDFQDKERLCSDLEIIKNEVEINYAPADWKKSLYNWSLDEEIQKAQQKIQSLDKVTPRQYQKILRDFFNSLQDLHVGVHFYSTEFATLPFLVQGVEGRYFIVWFDEDWAKANKIPLQIGDEVLAFDGRPLSEIIREIQHTSYNECDAEAYRRLSEMQLTLREGSALDKVPQGTVKVLYKKMDGEFLDAFFVEWKYVPEEIDQNFSQSLLTSSQKWGKHSFFHKLRMLPLYDRWKRHSSNLNYAGNLIGSRKSAFPPLGPMTWQSSSHNFDAYIYTHKKKSIGYVRIPDFLCGAVEISEFRDILTIMEGRTHALILDVTNNPGGYGYYAYAIAACLSTKPLMNLKEQVAITQEDVFFALQEIECFERVQSDQEAQDLLGEEICGYRVDKKFATSLLKAAQFLKDQFQQGKYFTDLYPIEGLEWIEPDQKIQYTKPILVLTNSLSMSCGDLLPALLQDNERAKILGTATAGAGGHVISKKYSNRFGVAGFSLTGSLIYRLNGEPLENMGVKPDFPYELTVRDYTMNYVDFINYVNSVVSTIK